MPSLSELQEFKASFHNIGGQKANIAAKGVPFDDLNLPDSEPTPVPADADIDNATPTPADAEPADFAAAPSDEAAGFDIAPVDELDFGALLGPQPQPDDLPVPPVVDAPEDEAAQTTDSLYPPDELLSDLSKELDAAPPDFPDEPVAADAEDAPLNFDNLDNFVMPEQPVAADSGVPPLDLDSLDNFDMPEEPLAAASEEQPPDLGSLDDLDLPKETAAAEESEKLDLDSLDNFDMPEQPPAAASEEQPLDLGNLDDLNLPEEPAAAAESESPDLADLDSLGDLDMPEQPVAADSAEQPLDLGSLDDLDLPEEPAAAAESESPDLADLDSLGDLDMPEQPVAADSAEQPLDLGSLDDLDLPEEPAAAGEGEGESESPDLDSLGDLDMPEQPVAADSAEQPLDLGNLDDLDLPEEPAAAGEGESENLDLDNLGDLDLSGEATPADESETPDLGNLDDLDLPEEPAAAAESESENLDLDNLDDLDLSGESTPADESETPDLDNLDDADLSEEPAAAGEGESESENLDLDNLDDADFSGEPDSVVDDSSATDDFSFPELDNVLKESKQPTTAGAVRAAGKDKRRGKGKRARAEPLPDDVEEIQLSDDEFDGLKETLSGYPLNLRVACEEIITEHAVNPKQMSELIEHLVWGASAKETAILASHILGRTITIPKGFQKSTGAALEAEQASFPYIFVHKFLPVLRLFMFIAVIAACFFYLVFTFVYIPYKAESIYKIGYERIFAGEYQRANERFTEAFNIHRDKKWFYKYAEAFRDERQYMYAEQKYDELLRYYPRDKKGVLDYASMETNYLRNYAKADNILRWQLLDYAPNDPEGLLAAGDNCLEWGEIEPAKYEDARYYYARLLDKYGWKAPVVERMMKYFIRTDNLKEVLPLKQWFDNNPKEKLSAGTLGELGGYLLDKQLEEVRGVPDEYIEYIGSVREMLLEAVYADPSLPEPHYHLARYYQHLGNAHEELVTLRVANRAFDNAPEGSIRRINYRIDTIQRYADALINAKEFFPAEEQLVKGINLYEEAISRRLISRSPKFGKLYAGMGDLEYFTKTGDMEAALRFYHRSEQHGWAPPEMQYRMGAAYYQLENWRNALEYLFAASSSLPLNRRILFALGNAAFKRGDYFAANGYYSRLLDILESQRSRLPVLLPNDRPEYLELAERLMMARNNAGAASEMLADQTGNRNYRTRALAFYAEANRAWDARTRDPRSMIRSGGTPLPFLNSRNALYPQGGYEPQIFIRIDREALETSPWESLAPLAWE